MLVILKKEEIKCVFYYKEFRKRKYASNRMKVLLINLYSTPDKFKRKKLNFIRIFKNRAKLIIKNWQDKKGIIDEINRGGIDRIILSGSDFRIKKTNKGIIPDEVFTSKIKILGICYGYQYMIYYYSSLRNIKSFKNHKYDLSFRINRPFKVKKTKYRFNHHDYIIKLPKYWKTAIKYKNMIFMAYDNRGNIGTQFHPEFHKQSSNLFFNYFFYN